MKESKQHYINKGKELGMAWVCFDDGVHQFQKGDYRAGFTCMYVTEECLSNGNAEYMIQHGLTLSDEKVSELQRKYRRKNKVA